MVVRKIEPRREIKVSTREDGNKTIETTVTTIYHNDGRIEEQTRTKTTTRTTRRSDEKQPVRARTEKRTTNKDGRRVEITTVTTEYTDGSKGVEVSERDIGPAEYEEHTTRNVTHRVSPSRRSSSSSSGSAPTSHGAALDDDINRLQAEEALKRAMRGRNPDAIESCITTCRTWYLNPDTRDLIDDGYDRMMELDASRGAAIANQKYKDLPYLGMKKYLRKHGVSRDAVDNVPGPYYKWELHKLASANGIKFPKSRRELEVLGRQKSTSGYNSNRR